jgi:dTDP-4-dehydrorhamnose reductase
MKKVLILGANGNLGTQLSKLFSEDYIVLSWDKAEIDIADKELILKKISDVKPDIIINTASLNNVDAIESDQQIFEMAKRINGDAPGFIADAAIKLNAILIHYSSDYVFKGDKKAGYFENDEPGPINKYGMTKLQGEQEIKRRSGKRLKWYIIRTQKLFGPKAESDIAKPSFFDIMLGLSKEKSEISAVNQELACFTYTPDLAKSTKDLIESGKGYGVYHISNSESCTWYKAAKALFSLANIKTKVLPVQSKSLARPAKRPRYSVLLNTKLEPLRSYKEALKEYLKISNT